MARNTKNMQGTQYSQLGQLESEPVLKWRGQTFERNFGKGKVLRIMTYWWLGLDPDTQMALYHLPADNLEAFFQGFHDADGDELKQAVQQYKQNLKDKEAG